MPVTSDSFSQWVFLQVYSNYGSNVIDATARFRDVRDEARMERERRRTVVHMPPPVILELCSKPLPEKIRPQPRGVMWLTQAQGGVRERRPVRNGIERKDATS